jgi:hypothetical protein
MQDEVKKAGMLFFSRRKRKPMDPVKLIFFACDSGVSQELVGLGPKQWSVVPEVY